MKTAEITPLTTVYAVASGGYGARDISRARRGVVVDTRQWVASTSRWAHVPDTIRLARRGDTAGYSDTIGMPVLVNRPFGDNPEVTDDDMLAAAQQYADALAAAPVPDGMRDIIKLMPEAPSGLYVEWMRPQFVHDTWANKLAADERSKRVQAEQRDRDEQRAAQAETERAAALKTIESLGVKVSWRFEDAMRGHWATLSELLDAARREGTGNGSSATVTNDASAR